MDLGFDGLIVESHCTPDEAWSRTEEQQQVTPDVLCFMLHTLVVRETTQTTEPPAENCGSSHRPARRRTAGTRGRAHAQSGARSGSPRKNASMPILQAKRYDEILNKRGAQAVELGINPEFVKTLLQAIHEESVHEQVKVIIVPLTRSPTGGNPSAAEDVPTQKQPVGKRGGAGFVRTMPRRENKE